MVGPTYGDFHIPREWTGTRTKALEIAQDSNVILRLQVREFVPLNEELVSDDARGNKMYGIPWAIANPDEAAKSANEYVDQNMVTYLETVLDDSNRFVFDVFHWALRLTIFPQPVSWSPTHPKLHGGSDLMALRTNSSPMSFVSGSHAVFLKAVGVAAALKRSEQKSYPIDTSATLSSKFLRLLTTKSLPSSPSAY
jgi:hypothetical protein